MHNSLRRLILFAFASTLLTCCTSTALAKHCPGNDISDCERAAETARNPWVPFAGAVAGAGAGWIVRRTTTSSVVIRGPSQSSTEVKTMAGAVDELPTEETTGKADWRDSYREGLLNDHARLCNDLRKSRENLRAERERLRREIDEFQRWVKTQFEPAWHRVSRALQRLKESQNASDVLFFIKLYGVGAGVFFASTPWGWAAFGVAALAETTDRFKGFSRLPDDIERLKKALDKLNKTGDAWKEKILRKQQNFKRLKAEHARIREQVRYLEDTMRLDVPAHKWRSCLLNEDFQF